jgi:hypothetical protein
MSCDYCDGEYPRHFIDNQFVHIVPDEIDGIGDQFVLCANPPARDINET